MSFDVILSLVAPLLLGSALWILWRARQSVPTSRIMIVGLIAMVFARALDAFVENVEVFTGNPNIRFQSEMPVHLDLFADMLDAVGAIVLVVGFVRTISYQVREKRHIESLETLLPICASCKRIRNADSSWDTIEQYLEKSGSPPLTHGICPTCKDEFVKTYKK